MNCRKSFSLLELVFVILIVSIFATFFLKIDDKKGIEVAKTQFMRHIRYTQHLAMVDEKVALQTESELRQKFPFKSYWQIQLASTSETSTIYNKKLLYYSIYSDTPTRTRFNFDIKADEVAIDPHSQKYLNGLWTELFKNSSTGAKYKIENLTETSMNLSLEYGIEKVRFKYGTNPKIFENKLNLFFDEFGRPYLFPTSNGITLSAFAKSEEPHPYKHILKDIVEIELSKNGEKICFQIHQFSGYLTDSICNF
ncbi:hypothetical protein ThvES_00000630 [Thiovulum sp. ES]|nr:hypothetical protein ThvES_00000630 [Thiovulum sp. ES]